MKTHSEIYKAAMSFAKRTLGSRDKAAGFQNTGHNIVEPFEADHIRMDAQAALGLTESGSACPDAMETPSSHIAKVVADQAVKNGEAQ